MKKAMKWMVCAASLMTAITVQADLLTFTLNEVGDDLVATVSGSVNTDALSFMNTAYLDGGYISPFPQGALVTGPVGTEVSCTIWEGLVGSATSYGTTPLNIAATSGSGDTVGMNLTYHRIFLSSDYVSGGAISGSATFNGYSIEGMALVPGTYTMTYNDGVDSVVVNVVPEPATVSLFGITVAVGFLVRRRLSM